MIKKLLLLMTILSSVSSLFAQSYDELWKQAGEAAKKDLPKTQMEVLEKIVKKAERSKDYGQLLKAQLRHANLEMDIAPDSLQPVIKRLEAQTEAARKKNAALGAVMDAVMGTAYFENEALGEDHFEKSTAYFDRAFADVPMLAKTPAKRFDPLVEKGSDSRIFGDDLLSLLGLHAAGYGYGKAYALMYDYYDRAGNRLAAMYTAERMGQDVDSLIERYRDLPECGYLAEWKVGSTYGKEEKLRLAREALQTWPGYRNANHFRNVEQELTNPEYDVWIERNVSLPTQTCKVKFSDIRNLRQITMRISNADTKKEVNRQTREYSTFKEFEYHRDSFLIPQLPLGRYLVEVSTSDPAVKKETLDYCVSNLTVITEHLPGDKLRFLVVNATTGKPVAGAKVELTKEDRKGKTTIVNTATTNAQGEYVWTGEQRFDAYRAYTEEDTFMPKTRGGWGNYSYYEPRSVNETVSLFTDRKLYRPGQTVHVSVLSFVNKKGTDVKATANQSLELTLRDANYKEVARQQVVTDSYGSASADFQLPSTGLTGQFSLRTDRGGYQAIRVEEYKRPTYGVNFDEVKTSYKAGDTLQVRGVAMSYAGVPVQGAKVRYTVVRRRTFWWWHGSEEPYEVADSETVTDGDGAFLVPVPLEVSSHDSDSHRYNFEVKAEVTDLAGESREGTTVIPLSSRPTTLDVNLADKVLKGTLKTVNFGRWNASGQEIDGDVSYSIDGGKTYLAKANTPVSATDRQQGFVTLASGQHRLVATCGDDKVEKTFTLFSLDDKQPAVETPDWFYQQGSEFGNDPVTIQVGSSDEDVTVFYSVFSANKELDHGSFTLSNSIRRMDYTYKAEYGSGLLLTYAWVKNGQCYTHRTTISKPLPDKRLQTKWITFRDRLTPGQQETWRLQITRPDGKPARAQLLATLFDKSLDQIYEHQWMLALGLYQNLPSTFWGWQRPQSVGASRAKEWQRLKTSEWDFSHFSGDFLLRAYHPVVIGYGGARVLRAKGMALGEPKVMESRAMVTNDAGDGLSITVMADAPVSKRDFTGSVIRNEETAESIEDESAGEAKTAAPQLRENLNETAFFYPAVETDAKGNLSLRFTLPESVTTWRFMGLAHDAEMNNTIFEAEAVAKKDVMVMPNVPRFVREGDAATIAARLVNTTDRPISGKARMQLLDPDTEQVVFEQTVPFTVKANETTSATFSLNTQEPALKSLEASLYICRIVAEGTGFSDGEQHYLPILPNREQIVNTFPFTQNQPGTRQIPLSTLVPSAAMPSQQARLTVEYTNSPAWLMVQALPFVGNASEENAISLAAAYYANSLGRHILGQSPLMKSVFQQWRQEDGGEASLQSALEKNQDLKSIVLEETPWVADADRETEQKKALANFFDENTLAYQLDRSLSGLRKLQNGDGSFSWWKGMDGSPSMTGEVMEFLTRLNLLTTQDADIRSLLDRAHRYLSDVVVKEVKEMKKWEKEKKPFRVHSRHALQWVYLCAVSGRTLKGDEQMAKDYLMSHLEQQRTTQSLYAKALMAVVLAKDGQQAKAREYVQSLMEYTVYTEEKGRYYDTPRAGYSWCDYRIPTQTAVIEALQIVTPQDEQHLDEMRRWLLQSKRTQAWDTPVNSVNAVFAFLNGRTGILARQEPAALRLNGREIETPKATAGLGYVKTVAAEKAAMSELKTTTFTAEKTSEGTSWGALYLQFMQPMTDVDDASSGLAVSREIVGGNRELKVGEKIKIRLTIEAERDYDFVQLIDKRAACLEPASQLSGYHWGYYIAPKDNATHYYFDRMSKGRHVIETEYFVDREGTYQTGVCTVQCAYSPEYTARAKAMVLKVKK